MEQDSTSISWKDLPWKKFQKKSFNLQCKIYKAKQNNNLRLVRRLQKLLISSKSIYYLAVKEISQNIISKGVFLSESEKFFLVNQAYFRTRIGKYFSDSISFRGSLNMSFLRNKVIEHIWKSIIEPTCLKNFISLHRRSTRSLHKTTNSNITRLIHSKNQTLVKIVLNLNLTDLNSNFIMSWICLPLKHKVGICKAIKKSDLKRNSFKGGLISVLFNILLEGIDNLNNIFLCKDMKVPYSCKLAFYQGNEIFYLLKKEQDKIYLYNGIQTFLETRGIIVTPSTIQVIDISNNFNFSQNGLIHRENRDILPSFVHWSNYKKYLIYVLKQKQIIGSLKIKTVKCMLLTWSQHANLCSKIKLKSSFFYLKKLLARSK